MTQEAISLSRQQPLLYTQLKKSVANNRLAHAYLFEGDQGVGKEAFGIWLAKQLFCTNPIEGDPCNECNNCERINHNEHPDVQQIAPDGQTIKVDQIRELKTEFTKSGMETNQKVFLIQQAEKMSTGAANSLLKFLEEPDGQVMAILTTTSLGRILPTIQSRCQVLHFQPLSKSALIQRLVDHGIGEQTASVLSELTNSFEKAVELSEDEWFNEARDTIKQWFTYLSKSDNQAFVYVQKKLVKTFKEKDQQRLSFELLLYYFEQQLAAETAKGLSRQKLEQLAEQIERILVAHRKWEANVSYQNVCEQLVIRVIALKEK